MFNSVVINSHTKTCQVKLKKCLFSSINTDIDIINRQYKKLIGNVKLMPTFEKVLKNVFVSQNLLGNMKKNLNLRQPLINQIYTHTNFI